MPAPGEIGPSPQVFLSHSSRDKPDVRRLSAELEKREASGTAIGHG